MESWNLGIWACVPLLCGESSLLYQFTASVPITSHPPGVNARRVPTDVACRMHKCMPVFVALSPPLLPACSCFVETACLAVPDGASKRTDHAPIPLLVRLNFKHAGPAVFLWPMAVQLPLASGQWASGPVAVACDPVIL